MLTSNPGNQEAEAGDSEFKASQGSLVRSHGEKGFCIPSTFREMLGTTAAHTAAWPEATTQQQLPKGLGQQRHLLCQWEPCTLQPLWNSAAATKEPAT